MKRAYLTGPAGLAQPLPQPSDVALDPLPRFHGLLTRPGRGAQALIAEPVLPFGRRLPRRILQLGRLITPPPDLLERRFALRAHGLVGPRAQFLGPLKQLCPSLLNLRLHGLIGPVGKLDGPKKHDGQQRHRRAETEESNQSPHAIIIRPNPSAGALGIIGEIGAPTRALDDFLHMAWFKKEPKGGDGDQKKLRTEGLWIKCDSCGSIIWKKDLEEAQSVCTKCGFHFKIDARRRLELLFDGGSYEEFAVGLRSTDALEFVDQKPYSQRLEEAQQKTGLKDAVIGGVGEMEGRTTVICAIEYRFIGGSMGAVVGEKLTRAIEKAIELKAPLVIVSASGGARMMEGMVSLVQMAKISAALTKLSEARLPFISVLTDPTTGGVTASFAMLGDLNIAEPGALIGFAGPRVIEQTIRQKLPKGFQRSEFLLEHGMLDAVVRRDEMRPFLAKSFGFFLGPAG